MGRVLFLAVIAILLVTTPDHLAAQGRPAAGTAPARPAAAPSAGVTHPGPPVSAGPVARPMGTPTVHAAPARTANGQVVVRRGAAGHSAPGTMRGRVSGPVNRRGPATTARRRSGFSEVDNDLSSAPGLGFDYAHFAATHPNGVHGRGRHNLNDGAVLFPFSGGGYFVPTGPGALDDQPVEASAADDGEIQPDADYGENSIRMHPDRPPIYGPPAPQGSQPDVPEYVFVRRDGTLFFAVAYSWDHDSLRYISSGGVRRSVSRDTLDLNATQQFNEQRGMTFRAPA